MNTNIKKILVSGLVALTVAGTLASAPAQAKRLQKSPSRIRITVSVVGASPASSVVSPSARWRRARLRATTAARFARQWSTSMAISLVIAMSRHADDD